MKKIYQKYKEKDKIKELMQKLIKDYKYTPLRVVVYFGDYELVEWLVNEVKVDVNEMSRNKFMRTALFEALKYKKQKIVKLLLKNGANIAQTMYSNN